MQRRQAERSDTTRRAIVDAARTLFAELGFERTSIDQVAEAAGVSKGALYHHYRDKTEVLAAVYEDMARDMARRLVAAVEPVESPLEQVEAGSLFFLDTCTAPAYARIALVDAPAALGWERWRQIDCDAGGFGLLQAGLRAAADAGEARADHLDQRAHLLVATLVESAQLIARSDSPAATRTAVAELIHEQVEALRHPPA